MLTEYPPASERAARSILKTGVSTATGAQLSLVHRTAGWEIAGSWYRTGNEAWGCMYEMRDGTTGGTWFKSLDEASARFHKFTGQKELAS